MQGLVERALVLHPPRPADARCAAACGAGTYAAGRATPPKDGTEVFVLARPGIYEAKGEFQLGVTRMLPTAASARRSGAGAGEGSCSQQDGLFDPARKRPIPELASTDRGGDQPRRRGAARHRDRGRKRWPCCRLVVVEARVQGDGRRARPGARARAGEPDPRRRAVHRGPGRRRPGGSRRVQQRSGLPRPRRGAGARPSPPSGTRPTSRSPISSPTCAPPRPPPPPSWRVADRREVLRLLDDRRRPPRARPRAPHPARRGERLARTADRLQGAASTALLRRERHRARPTRRSARRPEPAPRARPRLRRARWMPTAVCSSAWRNSARARLSVCGWPTATSAPGWSDR